MASVVYVKDIKNTYDDCVSSNYKCFYAIAPNGSRYVIKADDTATEQSIANTVRWNPEIFSKPPQRATSGYGSDPYFVNLIPVDNTISAMWGPKHAPDIPQLNFRARNTVLVFSGPLAVLAFGYVAAWIVRGFRSE